MKTTILLAALLSVGVFFQKENFISPSTTSTLEFHKNQNSGLTKENITTQSSSFISQFLKTTILPIGSIIFLIWIISGLDILRSVKTKN
ncbi:MAG: hypothetical protein AB8F94_17220 [Saprospiraceae bacterium]